MNSGISEEEMFRVVKTGKKIAKKGWKRVITKPVITSLETQNSCSLISHPKDIRRPRLHQTTRQIRALHTTNGSAYEENQCHPSRTRRHRLLKYPSSQKEPELTHLHPTRRPDQRNNRRGQRIRARNRHSRRKGRMVKILPNHQ